MHIPRPFRSALLSASMLTALVTLLACTGPEPRGAVDPTFTPTITPTPTDVPATPTQTPEPTQTPTPSPTPEPTQTPTTEPTPTVDPSPTTELTPTVEVTPTVEDVGLSGRLVTLEEIGSPDYVLQEEGTRSAQELANAYMDSGAHLQRLQDWGFEQHVFRAFVRPGGNEGDPEPDYILATINEYGSDEHAAEALNWLFRLGTSQGATEAEAPDVGDSSVAITIPTTGGEPTASIYIRVDQFVYIYFAQGGDPLPALSDIAVRVFSRFDDSA